jgi:anti-sigma-K factor RskA
MSSGQRSHEQIEELIAADALDGLEESGRRELAGLRVEHGTDCAECLRLETEYREVASQLATVVEPMPLSAGAEEALIEAARAGLGPRETAPEGIRRVPGGRSVQRWVATVAVAAAIALLGGVVGYSLAPTRGPLAAVSYRAGDQQLTLVYTKGQTQAVVIGSNLPTPPNGRVYELWYQPREGADMVPAGIFVPRNGTVVAPVTVGESFVAIAMSEEPTGGSPQPTTEPIFVEPV